MKKVFISVLFVILVAGTIFLVADPTVVKPKVTSNPPFVPKVSNNSPLPSVEAGSKKPVQQGAQAEIDQVAQDFIAKINEMDAFAKEAAVPVPEEYTETPEEKAEFEALIAKVEQETGQKFTGDIGAFSLSPEEHKEYYELEQKFDALDEQVRQIVNEL